MSCIYTRLAAVSDSIFFGAWCSVFYWVFSCCKSERAEADTSPTESRTICSVQLYWYSFVRESPERAMFTTEGLIFYTPCGAVR